MWLGVLFFRVNCYWIKRIQNFVILNDHLNVLSNGNVPRFTILSRVFAEDLERITRTMVIK